MSFMDKAIIVGKHYLDNKQEILIHVVENLPELLVHILMLKAIKDYE